MIVNIFKKDKFSVKNITENHIEITNNGFSLGANLKLYEINYNSVQKYNQGRVIEQNYSLCDDAFTTRTETKCRQ